jgi:hypothetical protein
MGKNAWFWPTFERLYDVAMLADVHNSYGSRKVTEEAVAGAFMMLCRNLEPWTPPPVITPTLEGGILLAFDAVDLMVGPDGSPSVNDEEFAKRIAG